MMIVKNIPRFAKSLSLLISLLFCALLSAFYHFKLIVNLSTSVKYGLYRTVAGAIKPGDYIMLCLSEQYTKLGLGRGYLDPGSTCHGSQPLIKQVIAVPYTRVQLSQLFIQIGNQRLDYRSKSVDSNKRKLTPYPSGSYQLNCYWLIGDYDIANSWDSRYWGCISPHEVLHKIRPLITW